MDNTEQARIRLREKMEIKSLSLDKEELRQLCDILQERAYAAGEIEVGYIPKGQQTEEQYETNKKLFRDSFILNVIIESIDGKNYLGPIEDVFNSPNFPDEIKSVYISSDTTLRAVHNYYPHNYFTLFLDFSKPKIFDLNVLPSNSTPNESNFEVNGYDATWVNGLFHELEKFVIERSAQLSFVHSSGLYDVLLVLMALPTSLWFCAKISDYINRISLDAFLKNAIYIYIVFFSLFMFRFLFHYARWICPLVEFRCKRNRIVAHRLAISTICLSWIGTFIYNLFGAFLKY